ncbi:nitrate reductase molybdenum cofactor assembly chaperone [Shewanella glacialipiscicola]|uniref:nitrate reductase molybdenum cofactor assembly chaperone n=1 Tax=Shewanella glacialipiscicola TaxID=614069 RepID=UPI0021DA346C|nr:nitrate reductase molybdenum cofactor assembly chaperone [Shewanella glacialipiscicola]MCU7993493.1 nitrate reductase molybdenum cofactor assembly chaperone [Shewanella glacialipiscicola]MCU8024810.1 nitrate reductase molybdenum cofactor assembly chaperone [Shewanella glacialipiscicola]
MKVLSVISILLDYPRAELLEARAELEAIVTGSELDAAHQALVLQFIAERFAMDTMDWQAEYDGLFERGRSLSLLLFEHVHGESRDRGQAMVNLLDQYHQAGLDISAKELPDYIPLYLEFMSTQGSENGRYGLEEVAPILALLACRLEKHQSNYANLLHALLSLSKVDVDLKDLREQIVDEQPDNTPKELDKVWEEEMVSFMDNAQTGCNSSNKPSETQRRDQHIPLNTELLQPKSNSQRL